MKKINIFSGKDYISRVETKKKLYDMYLPLSESEESKFLEIHLINNTYHSNNIEGNTYTLNETSVLIDKGLPAKDKTFKESLEIVNLYKTLKYYSNRKICITEDLIKDLHLRVTRGVLDNLEDEGNYRTVRNWVGNVNTSPPNLIPKDMANLIDWYNDNKKYYHPIELAVKLKYRFLRIHPFIDGNGRVSRILCSLILTESGYIDLVVPKYKRIDYYNSFDLSDELNGSYDCEPLIEFVCGCLEESYDNRIDMLQY